MYLINNVIDGKTYCLHDQRDRDLRVIEPRLIVTLNKTGALSFRIPQKHRVLWDNSKNAFFHSGNRGRKTDF